MEITTIKVQRETKQRIDKLKENKRESYDDLLRKMLSILNVTKTEPDRARKILESIDETRKRFLVKKEKKVNANKG